MNGGIWGCTAERDGSHVDGAGLVVVVAIEGNFVVHFVVEEAPEGELEEAVMERLAVDELAEWVFRVAGAVAKLLRVDGIEVRRVRWVNDLRFERRLLGSDLLRPVDLEERMVLDLLHVLPDALILAAAQSQNNVGSFHREFRLLWNLKRFSPMNHLQGNLL